MKLEMRFCPSIRAAIDFGLQLFQGRMDIDPDPSIPSFTFFSDIQAEGVYKPAGGKPWGRTVYLYYESIRVAILWVAGVKRPGEERRSWRVTKFRYLTSLVDGAFSGDITVSF